MFCPYEDSKHGSSDIQSVALFVHRLQYPSSMFSFKKFAFCGLSRLTVGYRPVHGLCVAGNYAD
jgi:hypothetical protein